MAAHVSGCLSTRPRMSPLKGFNAPSLFFGLTVKMLMRSPSGSSSSGATLAVGITATGSSMSTCGKGIGEAGGMGVEWLKALRDAQSTAAAATVS
jgi:hypothetical protein